MTTTIIYLLSGILLYTLVVTFVLLFVFRSKDTAIVENIIEKKEEAVETYTQEIGDSLKAFKQDRHARLVQKRYQLEKMSNELADEAVFDNNDIKSIVYKVAHST